MGIDYHVVATSKTSTMEKELNEAAEKGFHFESVMGGETAVGGKAEVVEIGKLKRQLLNGEAGHKHPDVGFGRTDRSRNQPGANGQSP